MPTIGRSAREYPLLRDAVYGFFQNLHEAMPARTFFVAESRDEAYRLLYVWNKDDSLLQEGSMLASPLRDNWSDSHYLGIPIILPDGKDFGQVCAVDAHHAFTREDIKLLEWLAGLIGRLIEVEEKAIHDDLTGVYQRKYAEALFYNMPIDVRKAVVFLEMDGIDAVNEAHGYDIGDELLKAAGTVLREISVLYDALACRYAGAKFLLILTDTDEETVAGVMRHLQDRLSQPLRIGDRAFPIAASAGVCLEAETMQEYILRAHSTVRRLDGHG